uniref:Peptidase S33 tripeptidyl aminopeptidase-like C-terminal domain-containing protein n=1 Tax=Peronospora matthiolae TaxID=2874970 RepID=A0AAV1TRA4_9STRA
MRSGSSAGRSLSFSLPSSFTCSEHKSDDDSNPSARCNVNNNHNHNNPRRQASSAAVPPSPAEDQVIELSVSSEELLRWRRRHQQQAQTEPMPWPGRTRSVLRRYSPLVPPVALLIALVVLLVQDHAYGLDPPGWSDPQLMHWTSCSLDNPIATANILSAQCATLMMPLCYEGACEHEEDNATIAVSFKRIGASNNSVSTRTLWFLPDRPDLQTREDVELQMTLLFEDLGRDVDIYTLDMRGTGNSTALACRSPIDESPLQTAIFARNNGVLDVRDVQVCVNTLRDLGYSDLGAFSLASASRDIEEVVRRFQSNSQTIVYALGYGSLVAQHLMHRNVSQVLGYVLDGALGSSRGATDSAELRSVPYRLSRSDEDFGEVAADFLAWCQRDGNCSMMFSNMTSSTTIRARLVEVYSRLDTDATSMCATILTDVETSRRGNSATSTGTTPPSYLLRQLLGLMTKSKVLWPFIPVVVYRFLRCGAEDLSLLTRFVTSTFAVDANANTPDLLYAIQAFSELWESPLPDQVLLTERFTNQTISSGRMYTQLEASCLFRGSTSDACLTTSSSTLSRLSPVGGTLSYAVKPMNTSAIALSSASVLLLSGGLDVVSPPRYSSGLFDSIQTGNKALLVAPFSSHGVVQNALSSNGKACGRQVLASYILAGGNLSAYDASCMAMLSTPSLAISQTLSQLVLGVDDAYDGMLVNNGSSISISNSSKAGVYPNNGSRDGSTASGSTLDELQQQITTLEDSRQRYEVALIVVASVLGAVLVVYAAVMFYRHRQKQQRTRDDLATLRRMRGDGDSEVELMGSVYLLSTSPRGNQEQTQMAEDRAWSGRSIQWQEICPAGSHPEDCELLGSGACLASEAIGTRRKSWSLGATITESSGCPSVKLA